MKNNEIFWEEHKSIEQKHISEARSALRLKTCLSLFLSCVKRLLFAFFVAPGVLIFNMFAFEAYRNGVAETYNLVFANGLSPITDGDVSPLFFTWHVIGLTFFVISWIYQWRSPVRLYTDKKMEEWWERNANRLTSAGK